MRVVIDPNVFVSALISPAGPPAAIVRVWTEGRFEIAVSAALIAELDEVLARPKFRRWISEVDAAAFVAGLAEDGETVADPSKPKPISPDPDDDYLLALAQAAAAATVVEDLEFTVIEQSVAASTMTGPEFAFKVNAPTVRRALDVARDVWHEVQEARGLPYSEPVFANVIPPGGRGPVASSVLDAFLEAIVDAGAPNGKEARQARDAFAGGASEAELAGRCVTMAALALRRTVGNTSEPRPIVDGDSAFAELEPAAGVPVRKHGAPVKKAAVAALGLAVDRLGPLPGGRLGSVRAPGAAPVVVEGRGPTGSDLVRMTRLAGEAVGAAGAESYVDVAQLMRRAVAGER